ncbi:hypothetical protein R6Q59_017572 [Mikania micrantha]
MSNRRPVIGELITPGFRLASTSLEFKVLTPTGVINRNMGGIGLGIVAALENIPAKKDSTFSCRNRMWSNPIPVTQSRTVGDKGKIDKVCRLNKDYTTVTSNKANKSVRGKDCIFNISPATSDDDDDTRVPQPAGFLNSCHLCNKKLHGEDIYMYRGEKAFCSPECRSRQIAMDERPKKYCCSQSQAFKWHQSCDHDQ